MRKNGNKEVVLDRGRCSSNLALNIRRLSKKIPILLLAVN